MDDAQPVHVLAVRARQHLVGAPEEAEPQLAVPQVVAEPHAAVGLALHDHDLMHQREAEHRHALEVDPTAEVSGIEQDDRAALLVRPCQPHHVHHLDVMQAGCRLQYFSLATQRRVGRMGGSELVQHRVGGLRDLQLDVLTGGGHEKEGVPRGCGPAGFFGKVLEGAVADGMPKVTKQASTSSDPN
eukprot:scaffold15896_cov65-Phaeocystis_antarctica.AAC.1